MSKSKVEKKEEGVKVYLRIRPFNKKEITEHGDPDTMPTVVTDPLDECKLEFLDPCAGFSVKECMSFDEIFWSVSPGQCPKDDIVFATQEYVYRKTGLQCLEHLFTGYNSCLLAYGQTGSGKTHSMMGCPEDEGIIPRLCKELFTTIHEKSTNPANKGTTFKVMLSFLEIYNEKVKDLLTTTEVEEKESKQEKFKDLKIRQHPTKGPFVDGLTESEVTNWKVCSEMIAHGFAARTTKATAMNSVSSRSHAIFKLELTQSMKTQQKGPSKQVHTISSINLVDLAGSERANRTGASGDTLTEGIAINQSLSVLRKVIEALMENGQKLKASKETGAPYKPQPPPYRESTLTWLLSESFGGNSKTMMIAAASPHESNAEETLQTLKYALKTKEIVNTVQRNEDKGMRMLREKNEEIAKLMAALEQASMNPSSNPAEVEEITQKLKEEQSIKKQLQEEHEKLTHMMEQKEEEMKQTREELQVEQEKARSEAEQRARTQRAANIMGKWTRGFALSLDSSKNKKIKERDTQLQQKEEELASERAAKKRLEEDSHKIEQERKELQETLGREKADMNQEIEQVCSTFIHQPHAQTKQRLQQEHESVINVLRQTLQEDNERMKMELLTLRAEHHKKVSTLERENQQLFTEAGKQSESYKVAKEGLDANTLCLTNLKQDNKVVRQELYEIQEANVKLREENSKMRLHQLQANADKDLLGGDNRPTARDMRILESRISSLLEDKTIRLKEIALLKADKKALSMEHKEMEVDSESSKKATCLLQGKLKSAETEVNLLKKQLKDEEERQRHTGPSYEDEQIIQLQAQNELLRRSKAKLEQQLEETLIEKETIAGRLNLSLSKDEQFPPSHRSPGSPYADVVPQVVNKNLLQLIKLMDGKITHCKKTLLELRMQPVDSDYETEVERTESMQTLMAHLLAEIAGSMTEAYEIAKTLIDRHAPRSPLTQGHDMPSDFQAEQLVIQFEQSEAQRIELSGQIDAMNAELITVRRGNDSLQEELSQARKALEDVRNSPAEFVTKVVEKEKIVEVPSARPPPEVEDLQEELEDAKAEAEFQEEMKNMLEEQLNDFKDFEVRYRTLKEGIESAGVKGADTETIVVNIKALVEQAARLGHVEAELEDAKKRGIGASAEDLEFYTTKAKVLEQTVTDMSAANRILENEMMNARYKLQEEADRRTKEREVHERKEQEISQMVAVYEDEVNVKFKQCKERHSTVWREMVDAKRKVQELQGASEPELYVEECPSPELSIEESLLDRHERLSAARRNLTEYIKSVSPHLILTEPSCSPSRPDQPSNVVRVLNPSNRAGIPTPTAPPTPRFAFSSTPTSAPSNPPSRYSTRCP